MLRIVENIIRCAVFDNTSGIHNGNPVAHAGNNTKVMGDHDDRHAKLLFQLHHQLKDLCLNRHVKGCCRLIGNQKLRFTCQCDRNHNTLSHTAG